MYKPEYMKKMVLEFPEWVTKEYIVARIQNHLTTESLTLDSIDKKFLVTVTVEDI